MLLRDKSQLFGTLSATMQGQRRHRCCGPSTALAVRVDSPSLSVKIERTFMTAQLTINTYTVLEYLLLVVVSSVFSHDGTQRHVLVPL